MKIYKFDNNSQLIMKSDSEKYYNVSVEKKEIEHFQPEIIYIDENQETYEFTCKHAASKVCVLKRNGTVIERHLYSPYMTYTKNAINNIYCCIRIKTYKNIEGTTTTERIIEQFTQILRKPTESNETDTSVTEITAAYLGLLIAIPAVLLAAVLIPIVYVCCKKTPQQKPLPNTTIPPWEPFYSNRMFQKYSNEAIYILPENNHIYARIKDVRTHQNYYYNYTYNEEHKQSMMKRFSM
ncbi:uncharacterized protein LOC118280395 isoform X2 [Spodoptera frugiperda]|nr:uncharacterized protein LOC118280395 isoform X2 [Spodoptera frugiperda]